MRTLIFVVLRCTRYTSLGTINVQSTPHGESTLNPQTPSECKLQCTKKEPGVAGLLGTAWMNQPLINY